MKKMGRIRFRLRRAAFFLGIAIPALSSPFLATAQESIQPASYSSVSSGPALNEVRRAYREGRNQETVLLADRAISGASSEKGADGVLPELHFWRGAALRRLERYQEALVAFESASKMGFVYAELHLERALTRRALGQEEAAEQDYREMERMLQEDPDRLKKLSARWERGFREEPTFQFWFTPQMGYDSNVVGVDEDTPLKGEDYERESFYAGAVFDLKYYLVQESNEQLYLNLTDYARAYEAEQDLSYNEAVFSAGGRYALLPWTDFEARLSWGESWLPDDGHHRTTRTVAPALVLHPIKGAPVRVWGDWTDADYYRSDLPSEEDRDGVLIRMGITMAIDLGSDWSIAPGVSVADYDAQGDDYVHDSWTVGVTVRTPEYLGCRLKPGIRYTRAEYENPNSVVNFAKERSDRILTVSLSVTISGCLYVANLPLRL